MLTEGLDYLPVSALAEVLYCPRNFYYRVVEAWDDQNVHTVRGALEDEKRAQREVVYRETGRQVRGQMVSSDALGLIAVVDAVEEGEALVPIEYKAGELRDNPNDDIQLCAEAMLLEEATGTAIPHGYVYYTASRRRRVVLFDDALRQRVRDTLDTALAILHSGLVPDPVADERCVGCSLAPGCLPHETLVLEQTETAPVTPTPPARLGRVLYVDEPGAYLSKDHGTIVVSKRRQELTPMPATELDQIVLVGNVQMSSQLIRFLMQTNVDIHYVSGYGRFEGRFVPEYHKNVAVRLAQYRRAFDCQASLELARAFVAGKLENLRALLMRQNRQLQDPDLTSAVDEIARCGRQAANSATPDELRGFEGFAARQYFSTWGKLLKSDLPDFDFARRTRRPPQDPVNALLGFAYAMLVSDAISALSMAGLDPYVGFYHTPLYGRPALALDLMEEFRPIIADSVVLTLINKRMVQPQHFERRLGGCFLTEAGREVFFRAWNQRRNEEATHPRFGYRLSYFRMIELQARFLAKVLTGDLEAYEAYRVR